MNLTQILTIYGIFLWNSKICEICEICVTFQNQNHGDRFLDEIGEFIQKTVPLIPPLILLIGAYSRYTTGGREKCNSLTVSSKRIV